MLSGGQDVNARSTGKCNLHRLLCWPRDRSTETLPEFYDVKFRCPTTVASFRLKEDCWWSSTVLRMTRKNTPEYRRVVGNRITSVPVCVSDGTSTRKCVWTS